MSTWAPSDLNGIRVKTAVFNLAQAAGTYTLLTAVGDVWVEVQQAYVKTAGAGLTSASIATNHNTPKSIVASTLAASILQDATPSVVTNNFYLPSGKAIQGAIVGTGSAGEIDVVVKWAPVSAGSSLV